MKVGVVDH